ncbi:MAG: GTP cyclohydrolase I FolE2 [Armatimonadetes bacterium]|nr:GTP cyclohydrolase I FolE2 [Armatimonadota bacterium]
MLDMQKTIPKHPFPLNKVGITNKKIFIKLKGDHKIPAIVNANVDLDIQNKGVHMSRHIESIQEVINLPNESNIINIPSKIVKELLKRHEYSKRAEVDIQADIEYETKTPVSKRKSSEFATVILKAVGFRRDGKSEILRKIGIKLYGMSVCPCGQNMVKEFAKKNLKELGYPFDNIKKILAAVPIATHNQRCSIEATIESKNESFSIDIQDFIQLINNSFSSETYSLMKRQDEFSLILKAHKKPLFVEDSARNLIINMLKKFGQYLSNEDKITIKQENFESIHKHNAFVEFSSSIGELKKKMGSYFMFVS